MLKLALFASVIVAGVGCRGGVVDERDDDTVYTSPAGHTIHETGAGGVTPPAPGWRAENTDADPRAYRMGRGTRYTPIDLDEVETRDESGGDDVRSPGTSETATGVGTTTDTGVNTENAGTGGDDNPYR